MGKLSQELQGTKAYLYRAEADLKNAVAEKNTAQRLYETEIDRLEKLGKKLDKEVLRLAQDKKVLETNVADLEKQVERVTGIRIVVVTAFLYLKYNALVQVQRLSTIIGERSVSPPLQ